MLITLEPEHWEKILSLSETINTSREAINVVWEDAAAKRGFIAASARVVDGEAGVIDAEPRPTKEYVKQKQILTYADAIRSLDEDTRAEALRLSGVTPKLDLASMLMLVQEGHSAADAHVAEPVTSEILDAEEAAADAIIGALHQTGNGAVN